MVRKFILVCTQFPFQAKFISSLLGKFDDYNCLNGSGMLEFCDGSYYHGEFKNNKPHGKGKSFSGRTYYTGKKLFVNICTLYVFN